MRTTKVLDGGHACVIVARMRIHLAPRIAVVALTLPVNFARSQEPATQTPPPPTKGLQIQSNEYTWKFGGYIKVDAIHDFDAIGSTDSFDPRTIPTAGGAEPDENTRIHARQTRFNVEVTGPTTAGPFRAFVEGDFFGDKNAFRLRHAYGTIGEVLAGQTWTTFMDDDAMPETLDFESPIAFPIVRQAQIRWTHPFGDGNSWSIAIEDPDSDVLAPTGAIEEPMPDLTARVRWNNSLGHVQLGLFGGMAQVDPTSGPADDAMLWGLNLSTKLVTVDSDNAIVQITYGDGVGRYRGGISAAPDSNGNLEAVPLFGALLAYQHYWSEVYRSNLAYSWGNADAPGGAPPTATEDLSYLAANFIWQYCERGWAGIEYLHGTNQTADGADGHADRVQLSLKFDI
jgi:hypothetical protein